MSCAAPTSASVPSMGSSVSSRTSDDSDSSDSSSTPSLSLSASTCDSTSSVTTLAESYDTSCASPVISSSAPSSFLVTSTSVHPIRANEHLAVLLPRSLWKPNSMSTTCDTFSCQTPFSFFERRHHCRKCGGVYCSLCSSRTTALLDVRELPFLNPPKGVSVFDFAGEDGGVVIEGRVCDECWEQLHTPTPTPRTPDAPRLKVQTRPSPTRRSSQASVTSPSTDGALSPHTPSDSPPTRRSSIASVSTRASNPDLRRRALQQGSKSPIPPKSPLLETQPLPQGELSTYPLCRSSSLCKASGGGRWVPQPEMAMEERRVIDYDDSSAFPLSSSPTSSLFSAPLSRSRSSSSTHRPISSSGLNLSSTITRPRTRSARTRNPAPTLGIGKPLWEVEWERQVSREKRRRENPVVRDLGVVGGDLGFCLRVYPTAPNSRCGSDDGLDDDEAEYGYAEMDGGYRIEEVLGGKGLGKESVNGDNKPRRSFSLSTF